MREYQQKKKLKRRIFSKISIILLAVIIFFLARSTFRLYQKNSESAANLARVNENLVTTEQRYDSLSKETERLKTNEGLEEEIRHKFQLSKEGEKIIVVIDDQQSDPKNATSTPFFTRLKKSFMSLFKND